MAGDEFDPELRALIERYAQKEEAELYIELGAATRPNTPEFNARPKDPKTLYAEGVAYLKAEYGKIRERICCEESRARISGQGDNTLIALCVADILTGLFVGVSLATVSWLLVRRGVTQICE